MFVVLGANGHTGSIVANRLLDAGKKVRLFVRDASKVSALAKRGAEVSVGSVESAADLARAFDGAAGAYLLLPPDAQSTAFLERGRRIANAMKEALEKTAVPHVVLLSSIGADVPSGTGPIATLHYAEKVLGALPKTHLTSIRASYFMENLLALVHPMKTDGVLPVFSATAEYAFPMIATKDIGDVAADALLNAPKATEIIELSGPKETSYSDAARAFGAAFGREVRAVVLPIDGLVPAFTGSGMSEHMASLYREMTEAFDAGKCTFSGKHRTVRGKVSIEELAKDAAR